MSEHDHPLVLYDGTILLHLMERNKKSRRFRICGGGHQAFEGLQHPDLIRALLENKLTIADSLLKNISAPLPPKDAMAACLCALGGSEKRMHAILDHAPPIPEFQFLGVGKTASLLNVAVRFKKHKMLHLLLARGADPNGGPTPQTAASPLEVAFCSNSYLCLERLLKAPGLQPELTPQMLRHWGGLPPDLSAPLSEYLMCCQLLLEALTGEPADPHDPFPCPPQLTLETVLERQNLPFATHICRSRPLSDAEQEAALRTLTADQRIILLDQRSSDICCLHHRETADFLLCVLERYPEWIHLPQLRFPIIAAALVPPSPEAALQALAEQLDDGPVFLRELSAAGGVYTGGRPYPRLYSNFTLSEYLFPRWDQRLGSRFIPTMDISAALYLPFMSDEEVQLVLDRIHFVGQRPRSELSAVGAEFLLWAPEALLPSLIQPGGLLALEAPGPLLEACLDLPPSRRNLILPFLHREADYTL